MPPDQVCELTIPLSPLLHPGERTPRQSKRMRPEDALDLHSLMKELEPNTLTTLDIRGKPWSVVSVFSPYSPDVHVMVIETGVDRYLPGPESITDDEEGDKLMELWAFILDFIASREANTTIHAGYNWSPRAWGEEEEKTGFQSVPTKWHAMLWGWPPFPKQGQTTKYAKWVATASLKPEQKRLLGDNNYAGPFGQLIRSELEKTFTQYSLLNKLFPLANWKTDGRGIYVQFSRPIQEILKTDEFFSLVLKPLAETLEEITRDLTEAMTDLDCDCVDEILVRTEKGRLSTRDLEKLRATPRPRSYEQVGEIFRERGHPQSLLDAIFAPVRNRCSEQGNRADWWRKGFGYALVFSSPSKGDSGELRIMPGVFVGPGGVVEAQGVVLKRPEDKMVPDDEARKKSNVLWQMAEELEARFPHPQA